MTIAMAKISDQEVMLWDQSTIQLKKLWRDGPLVLVFLRHFG